MTLLSRLLLASAIFGPCAAVAGEPTPPAEYRLSEAEVTKVLDEAAKKREASEIVAGKPKLEVHGEVGVTFGTGGYRSAYGNANVALPGDGFLSMSFDATRFGPPPRLGPQQR